MGTEKCRPELMPWSPGTGEVRLPSTGQGYLVGARACSMMGLERSPASYYAFLLRTNQV
jgi:hypothetical protein